MARLKPLVALLMAACVTVPAHLQGQAQRDAPYLVHAVLFKKNMTGARSKWEMFIREDLSVTINGKPDKPLSQEDFDALKKVIAATDFEAIRKDRNKDGYPSSKGGMDIEYFAKLEKGRAMIDNWDSVFDPEQPFIKMMDKITKSYKPYWDRLVEGGGRGGGG
jgi:hypothetical protein